MTREPPSHDRLLVAAVDEADVVVGAAYRGFMHRLLLGLGAVSLLIVIMIIRGDVAHGWPLLGGPAMFFVMSELVRRDASGLPEQLNSVPRR